MSGTIAVRTIRVVTMIAIPMSPTTWSRPTRSRKNAWKIGVKAHANGLIGSALSSAG